MFIFSSKICYNLWV